MAVSDYLEPLLLDHVLQLGTSDYTVDDNLYLSLYSTSVGDADSGTEISDTNYARQTCNSWNAANDSRRATNSASVTFPAPAASMTVAYVGIHDAPTDGNLLFWAALNSSRTFAAGDIPYFAAGELAIEFDTGGISTYLAKKLLDHVLKTTEWNQSDRITSVGTVSAADAGADTVTVTGHGLSTGDPIIFTGTVGTDLPSGLSLNTIYYANAATANTLKVYDTEANADAGVAGGLVDLTSTDSGGTCNSPPSTWISLYYTNPGDDDSGSEITGGDYSRIEVRDANADTLASWAAASDNSVTNTGSIQDASGTVFTASGAWKTINYYGIHDASSSGNLLFYIDLNTTATLASAETYTISDGDLEVTLD